jgi:hypothetical protein
MSGDKRKAPQDKPEVMTACDRKAGYWHALQEQLVPLEVQLQV